MCVTCSEVASNLEDFHLPEDAKLSEEEEEQLQERICEKQICFMSLHLEQTAIVVKYHGSDMPVIDDQLI